MLPKWTHRSVWGILLWCPLVHVTQVNTKKCLGNTVVMSTVNYSTQFTLLMLLTKTNLAVNLDSHPKCPHGLCSSKTSPAPTQHIETDLWHRSSQTISPGCNKLANLWLTLSYLNVLPFHLYDTLFHYNHFKWCSAVYEVTTCGSGHEVLKHHLKLLIFGVGAWSAETSLKVIDLWCRGMKCWNIT